MAEISGLKLIVPSSVSGSGVSVSASGKVTFTAATSVSVNGVFSATYDNYLIVMRVSASTNNAILTRLRASGSDASGTDYTRQYLWASSSSVTGERNTGRTSAYTTLLDTPYQGFHHYIYGPNITQPTVFRTVAVRSSNPDIFDVVNTHSLSTSYDGLTYIADAGMNITGSLTIYGLSQ